MAEENLKEILYDGDKVLVECAKRDDEGNVISSTYAKGENLPKLLPLFSYASYSSVHFFTYHLTNPNQGLFYNKTCTGIYIDSYDIGFKLSFSVDNFDTSDWSIVMFQRKKKIRRTPTTGKKRKGTSFTRSDAWDRMGYDDIASTIYSNFKTSWKWDELRQTANYTYQLDDTGAYIPMSLPKRRGNRHIPIMNEDGEVVTSESVYKNYKNPEIAFAICKLNASNMIIARGPMTIIKVGIMYKSGDYTPKYRWVS